MLDVVGHADLDDGPGPPILVLESLRELVHADSVTYLEIDPTHRRMLAARTAGANDPGVDDDRLFWPHYWDSEPCCYPDRTGDRTSVTRSSDFYSLRQLHASGMYVDYLSLFNDEYEMMVCLPSMRTISRRLVFFRGPGRDFTERDRLGLALLRPHLAELDERADRMRAGVPDLTPRQWELLELVATGRSNAEIAGQLVLSPHTVRTHLENIFARLGVTSRTAAVAAVRRCEPSFPWLAGPPRRPRPAEEPPRRQSSV
jgi:DNA-binding CsgD family transcriptional regulator